MSKEYIDRSATVDALNKLCDRVCQYSKAQRKVMCGACPLGDAFTVIEDDLPAADVVEVVRCKDCKNGTEAQYFPTGWWCWKHGFPAPKDGYCWEGVKRDG